MHMSQTTDQSQIAMNVMSDGNFDTYNFLAVGDIVVIHGVCSTSVQVILETNRSITSASVYLRIR